MKNYLQQRSKSLLAFAVGLTILSSSFAGEVNAECYYYGSDMATGDGSTTWDDASKTVTLHADRTIGSPYSQSLDCVMPYTVVGATKKINLTLRGEV